MHWSLELTQPQVKYPGLSLTWLTFAQTAKGSTTLQMLLYDTKRDIVISECSMANISKNYLLRVTWHKIRIIQSTASSGDSIVAIATLGPCSSWIFYLSSCMVGWPMHTNAICPLKALSLAFGQSFNSRRIFFSIYAIFPTHFGPLRKIWKHTIRKM